MAQDKYVDEQGKEFDLIVLEKVTDMEGVMSQLVAIDNDKKKIEKWGDQQVAHLFSAHTITTQMPQGVGNLLAYILSEMCHFGKIDTPLDMANILFNELPANVVHGISMNFFQRPEGSAQPEQPQTSVEAK